jgi:transposase
VALAIALGVAADERPEPGGVLSDLGDSSAGVLFLAFALVGGAAGAARAGPGQSEGRLMQLPTRWYLAVAPIDLRCGMDRLLVWIKASAGEVSGSVGYGFRNRAGTRLKLLMIDPHGVWLSVRRLHAGRFTWPRGGEVSCELSPEQFGWLCAGVDWTRLSATQVPTAVV